MQYRSDVLSRRVAFVSLTGLILLTSAVTLGLPIPGDQELVQAFVRMRSDAFTAVVWMLTFLSSSVPALFLCATLSIVEWLRTQERAFCPAALWRAAWPLVAFTGAVVCNVMIRILVGRMRPEVDYITHLLPEVQLDFQRLSYPSGHAGLALIAFSSLAMVLWQHPFARWPGIVAALLIIIGTGFGRIYLGVHWPSDVWAGYLLGIAWLSIARIACANRLYLVELLQHGYRHDT